MRNLGRSRGRGAVYKRQARRPPPAARRAVAHSGAPARPPVRGLDHDTAGSSPAETVATLRTWAQAQGRDPLAVHCDQMISASPVGGWHALPGPTGEANLYAVQAHPAVLCLADDDADRLAQLAAVLAVGSRAVWPLQTRPLLERLPPALREQIALAQDWQQPTVHFDAVLQPGAAPPLLHTPAALAGRPGPILHSLIPPHAPHAGRPQPPRHYGESPTPLPRHTRQPALVRGSGPRRTHPPRERGPPGAPVGQTAGGQRGRPRADGTSSGRRRGSRGT